MDKQEKKTILLVHNYYQVPGGEDTVVANEKKMLEEYGHKVFLYTRHNKELKKLGVLQKLLLPFTSIFNPRTYREVKKLIQKEEIKIVHVHNTLTLISPSVYYAAFTCKVPVVQTLHNFRLLCPGATFYRDGAICEDCVENGLRCAMQHSCYRDSWAQTLVCVLLLKVHRFLGTYRKLNYICLTEFNKDKLLLLNQSCKKQTIDPNKVFLKPNFTFDTPEIFNKSIMPYENFFLYIGRVEEIKGINILLKAFQIIQNETLIIVGSEQQTGQYQKSVSHCNNIIFTGYMKHTVIMEYIAKAKAVIVPSQCYETFGMIIVETYAAHKPVIVGNVGNIASLVEENSTGLRFQYNSYESLKKTIKLFNKIDTSKWGENAYKKFKQEFSPDNNYKVLLNIYAKIH